MFSPIYSSLPNSNVNGENYFNSVKNNPAGQVSKLNIDKFSFERQYYNFNNYGSGLDPSMYLNFSKSINHKNRTQLKKNLNIDVFLCSKNIDKEKKKWHQKRKKQDNLVDEPLLNH